MRGALTEEVQEIAKRMISREISESELRLVPYIQVTMVNDQKIDPQKINTKERKILQKWREEGFIAGGAAGLSITKDFWDFIAEILFESYIKGV